jgi:hypothetical protein
MAGEQKGKAYEALTRLVLDDLKISGDLVGDIFWDSKPEKMTIMPDLTIGKNHNEPEVVFLINHSGSAKNSDMKFWRNMGELAEAKILLPIVPRVYNLAFDSSIKEDLKAVQSAIFDGQLIVGDRPYGRDMQSWIDKHISHLPAEKEEKVVCLREFRRSDKEFSRLCKLFLIDLKAMVAKGISKELDAVWKMERLRNHRNPPTAKNTFVRRGVGKLLLLDSIDQVDSKGRLTKKAGSELAASLKSMGLAKSVIGGHQITDEEVLWVLRNLSSSTLNRLLKERSSGRILEWVETLRNLVAVKEQLDFLALHWKQVTETKQLFILLNRCHDSPHDLWPGSAGNGSRRVWLYHILFEWIKLAGSSRTGFGVAAFMTELKSLSTDREHIKRVTSALGHKPLLRSPETIRLGLQDWQGVGSVQRFPIAPDDLARVADVLALALAGCPIPNPAVDAKRLVDATVQTTLEAKLLPYRGFKPLETLLKESVGKRKVVERLIVSCFAERASAIEHLDPRSAGTTIFHVSRSIINSQSCSDAGRDHKKKELCGRAVALRYSWDAKKKKFITRPSVDKLILLLDGTWRQTDLDALVRAGWDEIYYPDEMDKLALAIV